MVSMQENISTALAKDRLADTFCGGCILNVYINADSTDYDVSTMCTHESTKSEADSALRFAQKHMKDCWILIHSVAQKQHLRAVGSSTHLGH